MTSKTRRRIWQAFYDRFGATELDESLGWLRVCAVFSVLGIFCLFLYHTWFILPSGDDWGFGVHAKGGWGVLGQMFHYYQNFHGRFSSHSLVGFIMAADDFLLSYHLFTFSFYLLYFGSIWYLIYLLAWRTHSPLACFGFATVSLTVFLVNQDRPDETYFWLTQVLDYSFGNAFSLLTIALIVHAERAPPQLKTGVLLTAGLCSAMTVGASEPSAALHPLLLGLFLAHNFISKSKTRTNWLGVFIVTVFFFLIAALSPGHAGRAALSSGPIKHQFLPALAAGCQQTLVFFNQHVLERPLLAILVLAALWPIAQIAAKHPGRTSIKWWYALALPCIYISVILFLQSYGCYTNGYEAAIPARATPPIDFYLYMIIFIEIFVLASLIITQLESRRKSRLTGTGSWGIVSNIAFTILTCVLANSVIASDRAGYLSKNIKILSKYYQEQLARFSIIEEAKDKGLSEVRIPRLSVRPAYFYSDIEDPPAFGYDLQYARFLGLEKVVVDGNLHWIDGQHLDRRKLAKQFSVSKLPESVGVTQ